MSAAASLGGATWLQPPTSIRRPGSHRLPASVNGNAALFWMQNSRNGSCDLDVHCIVSISRNTKIQKHFKSIFLPIPRLFKNVFPFNFSKILMKRLLKKTKTFNHWYGALLVAPPTDKTLPLHPLLSLTCTGLDAFCQFQWSLLQLGRKAASLPDGPSERHLWSNCGTDDKQADRQTDRWVCLIVWLLFTLWFLLLRWTEPKTQRSLKL